MIEAKSLLQDLDDAIARGTDESRSRALWHATDLLITGRYSEDEIGIFGEVIGRLADEIEIAARVQLSELLASCDHAPLNVIRQLAFDDEIVVAGPVLRESSRIDDETLLASAMAKDQPHLLAISQRTSIGENVTDVLVKRGDREVVRSVAKNEGARFSGSGLLHMVKRADGDSILAEQLGLRKDIPRHVFQQLIAKASDDVRKRLASERPEMVAQIQNSVTDVTGALQSKFGPGSRSYFVAKRVVTTQYQLGNLTEDSISGYARAHRFDEVTIGLSLMCSLPVDVIERALMDRNRDMLLVLAKAIDFSWSTIMSLLFLGAKDHCITAGELFTLEREFARLNIDSSRSILEFYQSRKNVAPADHGLGRELELQVH